MAFFIFLIVNQQQLKLQSQRKLCRDWDIKLSSLPIDAFGSGELKMEIGLSNHATESSHGALSFLSFLSLFCQSPIFARFHH